MLNIGSSSAYSYNPYLYRSQTPSIGGNSSTSAKDSTGAAAAPTAADLVNEDTTSQATGKSKSAAQVAKEGECQTCKNRKYQDGSDDPGVSFKTAGKIGKSVAASTIRAHEEEHVHRNAAKAQREGREVVSSSVVLHTGVCPECGSVYYSGGTTTTVTRNAYDKAMETNPAGKGAQAGQTMDKLV